jgi:hypothetical protein
LKKISRGYWAGAALQLQAEEEVLLRSTSSRLKLHGDGDVRIIKHQRVNLFEYRLHVDNLRVSTFIASRLRPHASIIVAPYIFIRPGALIFSVFSSISPGFAEQIG